MSLVLPGLRYPKKGLYRPPGKPRINWAHPFATGLVGCYLPFGGMVIDLTGRSAPATKFNTARPPYFATQAGGGLRFPGGSADGLTNNGGGCPFPNANSMKCFLLAVVQINSLPQAAPKVINFSNNGSTARSIGIGYNSSSLGAGFIDSAGTSYITWTSGTALTLGVPYCIGMSISVGGGSYTLAYYFNGTKLSNSGAASPASSPLNTITFGDTFFSTGWGGAAFMAGVLGMAAAWNYIPPDQMIFDMVENPYAYLTFPQDELMFDWVGLPPPPPPPPPGPESYGQTIFRLRRARF